MWLNSRTANIKSRKSFMKTTSKSKSCVPSVSTSPYVLRTRGVPSGCLAPNFDIWIPPILKGLFCMTSMLPQTIQPKRRLHTDLTNTLSPGFSVSEKASSHHVTRRKTKCKTSALLRIRPSQDRSRPDTGHDPPGQYSGFPMSVSLDKTAPWY